MGAVAPPLGSATGYEDGQSEVETYSSKNLSAYNNYVAVLAEKNNRPSTVAMAMVDRNIEVIEVTDKSGQNRALINRTDKRPNQTVVRTWAQAIGQDTEVALMLTPSDAVYSRMADKVVHELEYFIRNRPTQRKEDHRHGLTADAAPRERMNLMRKPCWPIFAQNFKGRTTRIAVRAIVGKCDHF